MFILSSFAKHVQVPTRPYIWNPITAEKGYFSLSSRMVAAAVSICSTLLFAARSVPKITHLCSAYGICSSRLVAAAVLVCGTFSGREV